VSILTYIKGCDTVATSYWD